MDDFDLENFDLAAMADGGAELVLKNPHDGGPLLVAGAPVTISLIGADSEERRKAERALLDRNLKKRQGGTFSADDIDDAAIEILTACTKGWTNMRMGGETLAFAPKNAKMVYGRFRWIREQVEAFVNERQNFMKASSLN